MASVESIGACSLDLDSSDHFMAKDLTASECTLLSNGITPSIPEAARNGDLCSDPRTSGEISALKNCFNFGEKGECSVAEIKLPSYLSISCAINGYANYSRFCKSRENSPARASFRKSSLEPSMLADMNRKESVDSNCRYSRSQSDCNGTMRSIFIESRHVTVSKQLQIPLRSSKQYTTEVTLSNGHSTIDERTESESSPSKTNGVASTNGAASENLVLAKEVGNGGTKSLVQQRIESLYGKSLGEEIKINIKSCKMKENALSDTQDSNGALNDKSHTGPVSPPVFRHLNKDFRKQLQQANIPSKKSDLEKVSNKPAKSLTNDKNSFAQKENFSPVANGVTHDECDRVKSMTPPPLKSFQSDKNSKVSPPCDGEREGYKFLNLVDIEKEKIEREVKRFEEVLKSNPNIPEEASGKIRAACGKANLLMSQKFEQFKGLCWKNIEESPSVPFYTTASDLAGFWDMVLLQVNDIHSTFADIEAMQKNGWKEVASKKLISTQPKFRPCVGNAVSRSNPTTPKRSAKSTELMKAREEARKQLLAAKKKGRQQAASAEEDIAIFTPPTSN